VGAAAAADHGLAAVALLVVVAVREAGRAAPGAGARGARHRRHVARRAHRAAAAAVVDVGAEHLDFAAVGLLVAIAVAVAGRAVAIAGAAGAGDGRHVAGRAHRAAAAAVVRVTGDVGLTAVGLLVAIAVREARRAHPIAGTRRRA